MVDRAASLTIRLPMALKAKLERMAAADHRTLSSLVLKALTEAAEATEKPKPRRR
jgi:predicted transcriptional regulator